MLEAFKVIFVSAMPISELRGGIPLALYLGFTPMESYILAFLGNLIPIPFLLVFLDRLLLLACKVSAIERFYKKLVSRVERRKKIVDRYGYLGLTLFVAIPLPVTGAWTGALLAFLLRMDTLKSIVFIAIGVAIAGVLVISASLGILNLLYFV